MLLVMVFCSACAGEPQRAEPAAESSLPRQTAPVAGAGTSQDGVTVRIAIPTDEEVSQHFGLGFAENGIQPIWLRIENASDVDYWLLPIAVDPTTTRPTKRRWWLRPGSPRSSASRRPCCCAPTHCRSSSRREAPAKATCSLRTSRGAATWTCACPVTCTPFACASPCCCRPEGFDYERSALRQLYAQVGDYPDLTVAELRQRLRELPCCTTSADGAGAGDPLNVGAGRTSADAIAALVASGWNFTEAITVDSVRRMVGAAIAEKSFLTAPVSSLYAFGRKQDLALQRGRSTISQRNHMRLWLAPFRCEGRPVWSGRSAATSGSR